MQYQKLKDNIIRNQKYDKFKNEKSDNMDQQIEALNKTVERVYRKLLKSDGNKKIVND